MEMMRSNSVTMAILLLSFCFSGCIENDSGNHEILQENDLFDFVVPDPNVYQCFEFEGWDRCWLTYFPENANLSSIF